MSDLLRGVGLTMIAGLMSGNCMLPMKFARRWKWENVWLVFSVASLLVLPWIFAVWQVDDLWSVYRMVSVRVMATPFLFGGGWGVAQILFGISVRRLGMGVAYAIIVGLGAVFGTLVPLFLAQRGFLSNAAIIEIITGVIVMVIGITLTTLGGHERERSPSKQSSASVNREYVFAVLTAILCGVMAPMLNYGFAFGQQLAQAATSLGNSASSAAYAVWPIVLLGGLIPNLLYSGYLLRKNRSWTLFGQGGSDAGLAALMAVLWVGAISLYGVAAVYLGPLGTSIGWGLLQIFMIMTATMSGVLTAEWKNSSQKARLFLTSGIACLIGATMLLTLGSR